MQLESTHSQTTISVECEILPVFQTQDRESANHPYADILRKLKHTETFTGKLGQTAFVRFGGKDKAESVLFVGCGPKDEFTEEKARVAGGHTWSKLATEKTHLGAIKTSFFGDDHAAWIRAFAEGLVLNAYQFHKYLNTSKAEGKTVARGPSAKKCRFIFVSQTRELADQVRSDLEDVSVLYESVNLTRDWSNEPSNIGTPEFYAKEAQKLAKKYGLKCKLLNEAAAKREKMDLYLAVGQGSEREGYIVQLEYNPKGVKKPKTVCLVGKGITFDSGGISIKPSLRMEEMKHDMTGAATVMGAVVAAARLQLTTRVIAFIGMAENMPSGIATQPGNIIRTRSGKTVEIINTDAEGRLILADILDYAQDFKPDCVVDVATLTGAVGVALGKQCAAILGNDDELIADLVKRGAEKGERLWQLPLWDEYFEDMKTDHADMRNSCNDSNGGTIRGAIFLKQFIRKGVSWAHMDIASMANGLTSVSYLPKKGASGIYVRTLVDFIANYKG